VGPAAVGLAYGTSVRGFGSSCRVSGKKRFNSLKNPENKAL
jgi:hypothetical protein